MTNFKTSRQSTSDLSRRTFIRGMAASTAILTASIPGFAFSREDRLQAGAAKRIITPNPLLPVSGGMGPTHPTKEKRGEITARAFFLKKGDVSVVIVGLDLLGFPGVLADRVRARVPRIAAENIIIGSTHPHCALPG